MADDDEGFFGNGAGHVGAGCPIVLLLSVAVVAARLAGPFDWLTEVWH